MSSFLNIFKGGAKREGQGAKDVKDSSSGNVEVAGFAEMFVGGYSKVETKAFFNEARKPEIKRKVYARTGDGLVEATRFEDCKKALYAGGSLYRVTSDPWNLQLQWIGETQDGVETIVELAIYVQPVFSNSKFWNEWERRLLCACSSGGVLKVEDVASRVADFLDPRARDFLRRTTYANLSACRGEEFWREKLESALGDLGLKWLSGKPASFMSPTKEKERAFNEAKSELERRKTEQELRFEARLQELQSDLDDKRLSKKYENALKILEKQREELDADSELAEIARRIKKWELEFKQEIMKKEHELEKLKLERAIKLAQEQLGCERAGREESLEELDEKIAKLMKDLQDFIRERKKIFDDFMKGSGGAYVETNPPPKEGTNDPAFATSAAWDLFTDDFLDRIGVMDDPAYFRRAFSRRCKNVEQKVVVECEKTYRTRNVVVNLDVAVFNIRQELKINFRSPIDGYATVLNLGTSYDFLLVVPNGSSADDAEGTRPEEARVKANQMYSIPDGKLYRHNLFEGGPLGWEEFVVIVTKDRPLFEDGERFNQTRMKDPLADVAPERLTRLLDELEELNPKDYAAGVYGFTVIDPKSR